ncbi:MAG: hypothetical protein IKL82_04465 [Clostridia bacterium]|nr:hypothetical protein [Clostridia bacterium]
MDKIVFNSANKIISYDNGTVKEFEPDFYTRYVTNSIKQAEQDAWKHSGFGAQFRGDAIEALKEEQANSTIKSEITGLCLTSKDNLNYSIFINDISGVYSKDLNAEKSSESHVIHDNNKIIRGAQESNGKIAFTVSNDGVTSHLAIFNKVTDDYQTVTDGDSFDEQPYFSMSNENNVLFASKGVGRDGNGNFVEYSPSYIMSYNLHSGDIVDVYGDNNYSFIKPKDDLNGNLYAIRKPVSDKKRSNIFIDILLIPVKLIMAIYYFLESFTRAFTGKNFTEKSANPAKTNNKSAQRIFVEGNEIYADKEYKNNLKHKDDFAGIIPRSYELVKISGENVEVIKKGVIAYDVLSDGTLVVSNGKHILHIDSNGKTTKLANANLATQITSIK